MTALAGSGIERSTIPVAARDGTRLATDVYLPARAEPLPALLLRTPYGRRDADTGVFAHPVWYARQGFAVVVQDCRGRNDAEGQFRPYASEALDGVDAIRWVAGQPWCNGRVGTYGSSYAGAVQLLAAAQRPEALAAIAPAVTAAGFGEGWTYRGGALQLGFVLSWALTLAKESARRAGDNDSVMSIARLQADPTPLFAHLPVSGALPPEICRYAPFLQDWVHHGADDAYWATLWDMATLDRIAVPGLHVAGWYDLFVSGTLDTYSRLCEQGRTEQSLIVGPWAHHPWTPIVGEQDFGAAAASVVDEAQLHFFSRWLRDAPAPDDQPPVRLFVMGANRWRHERRWPCAPDEVRVMFLSSAGRANSSTGDGVLRDSPPTPDEPADLYVSDPANPLVSLGGRSCCEPAATMGPADQSRQETRNDLLVYDSEVLSKDLLVIGEPRVLLFAATDVPSVDFVVRLVDVAPCGRAIGITDGNVRLPAGADREVNSLDIALAPTAMQFAAGHRIRLEVASSSFPVLDRNPQSGAPPASATWQDLRVATNAVLHNSARASRLVLPVLAS